ncbi:hypothetical protein [Streptomyces sp. NPDC057325]|uniref:hypothetical protein n=1 Tax=unclassified Streptomyces TaxID=2593676 RepID=UPI003634F2F7
MDEAGADEVSLVVGAVDDGEVVGRRADAAVHDDGIEVGVGEELFDLGKGDGRYLGRQTRRPRRR